jgi:hypothetical protein
MKHALRLGMLLSITAALAPLAAAQIDSHCVPPELPTLLFPVWVTQLLTVESQEISAPLLTAASQSHKPAAKAPGGQDRPDATTLAEMCREPREAIGLAEAGKFKEAAKAGDKILESPRERFRDFTWDYLANATAWSFIQCGDLVGAMRAHTYAANLIDDPAVSEYHTRIARMLNRPGLVAGPLKDYAAYKAEVQKVLDERVEDFRKTALPDKKIPLEEVRLGRLRDAYTKLRVLAAFDTAAAKQEIQATYAPAANGLVNDVLPPRLAEGGKISGALMARTKTFINDFAEWNSTVALLQMKVREIKRLCRLHDYLVRMNLAKAGGADRMFGEAHQLLFAQEPDHVWQALGRTRFANNIKQVDIRLSVPYQETLITPMGVPFAGQIATPENAWKTIDGPVTGQMNSFRDKPIPKNDWKPMFPNHGRKF